MSTGDHIDPLVWAQLPADVQRFFGGEGYKLKGLEPYFEDDGTPVTVSTAAHALGMTLLAHHMNFPDTLRCVIEFVKAHCACSSTSGSPR